MPAELKKKQNYDRNYSERFIYDIYWINGILRTRSIKK